MPDDQQPDYVLRLRASPGSTPGAARMRQVLRSLRFYGMHLVELAEVPGPVPRARKKKAAGRGIAGDQAEAQAPAPPAKGATLP